MGWLGGDSVRFRELGTAAMERAVVRASATSLDIQSLATPGPGHAA